MSVEMPSANMLKDSRVRLIIAWRSLVSRVGRHRQFRRHFSRLMVTSAIDHGSPPSGRPL